MDLGNLDVTPASEAGKFMPLTDPLGRPVKDSDGKPVGFFLLGANSASYKARERATYQKRQHDTRWKRGRPQLDLELVQDEQRVLYASAVQRCIGIVVDGKVWPEKPPITDIVALFRRFSWIELQVSEFITDDANWLGEASTS